MKEIIVRTGEIFEQVLINTPGVDWHIIQEANSRVRVHVLSIYALPDAFPVIPTSPAHYNITVEQKGEGCSTELYGGTFLHNNQQVSIETHVTHTVGNGQSEQLIKFVLDGASKGSFVGDLKIAQDAQQTIAHQTNRNILLSENATMHTMPKLEIYADDVQATHGATTGQLDEKAIFYMQQRGISELQARRLLISAFMKEVISTIADENLRQSLLDAMDSIVEES